MVLSLLCLIGLRRNQIERDNCVPVTFPPRQADMGGRRAHREGRWVCAHEGWCIQYSVCANMHPFWIKEAPQSPLCCCPVLNSTSRPVCPKGNNILYWGFKLRVQFFIKMIFWRKTAPICSHYHLNVADPSVNWPWCWTGLPAQMNKHDDITHSAEVSKKSVNTEDVRVCCLILKVIFYWHGFDDTFDTDFPLYSLYLVHPTNPFHLCIKMKNAALQWRNSHNSNSGLATD